MHPNYADVQNLLGESLAGWRYRGGGVLLPQGALDQSAIRDGGPESEEVGRPGIQESDA